LATEYLYPKRVAVKLDIVQQPKGSFNDFALQIIMGSHLEFPSL